MNPAQIYPCKVDDGAIVAEGFRFTLGPGEELPDGIVGARAKITSTGTVWLELFVRTGDGGLKCVMLVPVLRWYQVAEPEIAATGDLFTIVRGPCGVLRLEMHHGVDLTSMLDAARESMRAGDPARPDDMLARAEAAARKTAPAVYAALVATMRVLAEGPEEVEVNHGNH